MLILLPKINDLKQNGNAPNGKLRDDQCSPGIINLSEIDLSRLGSVLDRNRSQQSPRLHHHLLGSTARRRTEHEINSELALGKEIEGKADTQRRHQKNGHRSLVSMLNNIKTTVLKWGNGNTRKSVGLGKDTDRNIKISDNSFRQIDLLHSSNGSVCTDDVSVVNVGNHRDMSASMDTICVDIDDLGCSDYHDTITIGRRKVTRI
ncbi:hypothetical protein DPMN_170721 [Dreissena polymorpha]|uniref:Uncharacterized protein n=2 Tax=Dreissena polymorpha TaxID=45954 RepID=A0A9D4DWP4_DREPO|nr:hypothetical protein DPMN_170721 [Dreissena polymorpha]